jgi:hypothetical protein
MTPRLAAGPQPVSPVLAAQYPGPALGIPDEPPNPPRPGPVETVAQHSPPPPVRPIVPASLAAVQQASHVTPIATTTSPPLSAGQPAARAPLAAAPPLPPPVNTTGPVPPQPAQAEPPAGRPGAASPPRETRSLAGRNILVFPSQDNRTDEPRPEPAAAAAAGNPPGERSPAADAVVRMVNTKRVNLNYEVKDVGPSGISGVELWYTQDGRNWKKHEGPAQWQPPFVVELPEEGLYGLTLLARNGAGGGKDPPRPGDQPQVWVEVDLTKPIVAPPGAQVQSTAGAQVLTLRWTSSDKNLALKPITIACAEQAEGPWTPIATGVENTGHFTWPMPSTVPRRFHVRVEATDLAGNVGMAQAPAPINLDSSPPTVSILAVEPSGK